MHEDVARGDLVLMVCSVCTQSPMSRHLRAQIHSKRDTQEDKPDANGNGKSNHPITVNT